MNRILVMQLVVLAASLTAGGILAVGLLHHRLDQRVGQRALSVAGGVAGDPSVRQAVANGVPGDPGSVLGPLTARLRQATGAQELVIANTSGAVYGAAAAPSFRHTASLPAAFAPASGGTATPAQAFRVSVDDGTVFGEAPIVDVHGAVVGEVVAGFPGAWSDAPTGLSSVLYGMLVGLAGGAVISAILSHRLQRRMLGLHPDELVVLFQERQTTLHAIAEGVVCFDDQHRVRFINEQAGLLLGWEDWQPGQPLEALVAPGRLQDAMRGRLGDADVLLVVNEQVVVSTHTPVFLQGRQVGSVVVLRDRTEPESLLRELDSVLGLTEALRAQAHEFSNRLHTLVGLVQLGRYDDAVRFVTDVSVSRNRLIDTLVSRVHNPMVVALLVAKTAVAAERQVEIRIAPETDLQAELREPGEVVTVLGNLVDNAIDAAISGDGDEAWVRVCLTARGSDLMMEVGDSGPGIPDSLVPSVFVDGFTTKDSANGARRGLGLALVRQVVQNRGGSVNITRQAGAVFEVVLPGCVLAPGTVQGELTRR